MGQARPFEGDAVMAAGGFTDVQAENITSGATGAGLTEAEAVDPSSSSVGFLWTWSHFAGVLATVAIAY